MLSSVAIARASRVVPWSLSCGVALLCAVGPVGAQETLAPKRGEHRPARDPRWAIRIERPGLTNLHAVSPTLYRGAQPTAEGLLELRRLGVKTVVSLRAFHGERRQVESAGLRYEWISFATWHPEDSDMRRFVAIVSDPARQPVFVHCMRGADRTGMAVAVYRICVEGWDKDAAIDEMTQGGFAFERRFTHLTRYLRTLDVDACRGEWQRREPAAPTNVRR